MTISLKKEGNIKIFSRNCVLQNFFRIIFFEKRLEIPVKKLIVISILFKKLFKLHNLYMEKFYTATNRIATEIKVDTKLNI